MSKRTADDFRTAHSRRTVVISKIRQGLKDLGNSWMYEREFLKLAKLATFDLARYREEFAAYYLDAPHKSRTRRVWCGTPAMAKKLRAIAEEQ